MRVRFSAAFTLVIGLVLSLALPLASASDAAAASTATSSPGLLQQLIAQLGLRPAPTGCAVAQPGNVACAGEQLVLPDGTPYASSTPTGYGPADLQSAYNVASAAASAGVGQTVALVDAYDDPNAAADLATYRSTYGLPACAAGTCFRKVNQSGAAGPYPAPNAGWATEISLGMEMVSAMCPQCHILLVEANSPTIADLAAAENTAATLGATEISNEYGGSEAASDTTLDASYDHPGIAITASSGDSGYGVNYPASSPFVTAVGGTTLTRSTSTSRGWTESAWSGAGAGCSAYEPKPTWQTDPKCAERTVADVSAVADPATGVAVYDSYGGATGNALLCGLLGTACPQPTGWFVVGGTSVSAPIVASVYALAGNAASITPGYPYAHSGSLNDVTTGNDWSGGGGLLGLLPPPNCGSYLCNAGPGYDGPTGLGTPNGTAAF
ncbi:MAG TPA: hypothetical protein VE991_11440 [Acidimicrobiales bacterium]|nr:hypothetical protein [Acidimicrobiales bacterium]